MRTSDWCTEQQSILTCAHVSSVDRERMIDAAFSQFIVDSTAAYMLLLVVFYCIFIFTRREGCARNDFWTNALFRVSHMWKAMRKETE